MFTADSNIYHFITYVFGRDRQAREVIEEVRKRDLSLSHSLLAAHRLHIRWRARAWADYYYFRRVIVQY